MTEPKWTPGPWQTIMHNGSPREERQFADANGRPIGICHPHARGGQPSMVEARANARLVAAAPELYLAARAARERMESLCAAYPDDGWSKLVLSALSAALTKADGEPS